VSRALADLSDDCDALVFFTVGDCGFCALLSVETPTRQAATQVKKIMRTKVQQNLPVRHGTGDGGFTVGSFCNLNSNHGGRSEARSFKDRAIHCCDFGTFGGEHYTPDRTPAAVSAIPRVGRTGAMP